MGVSSATVKIISQSINDTWLQEDIEYAANFGIESLKAEIRASEYCESINSGCVGYDLRAVLFEREFRILCKSAIELLRSRQPKVTSRKKGFIDVESIKARTDIVTVAERYVRLIRSGRSFKALCPFHDEKKPSFMVYPDRQIWHCYGACNTGGDVFSLVMRKENCDFKTAVGIVGGGC
ncbi:MAG: CHC2 zinc finger domain-containing protein [Dehalococcoidales bacterium]|nr:CHC2 zinc finger domain-containing protein [Dehalococcoidales bacterium]